MSALIPSEARSLTRPRRLDCARLFLLIAPFLYALYALITPPFQTPDEPQHLFRAWQLSELHLYGERRGSSAGGVLPASLGRAVTAELHSLQPHTDDRPVIQRTLAEGFGRSTRIGPSTERQYYDFRGGVLYAPAGYLPQVAAVWIGEALDLSIENIVRLGRLLNATVGILLIYAALRLTPLCSTALLFVGLFPMTAAASAAFGQDALIIGGSCLLTAVGLRSLLLTRPQRVLSLASALLTSAVALSKPFYLPLSLIGAQPFTGGRFQPHRLWSGIVTCSLAVALTGAWVHLNAPIAVPPWSGIPPVGERLAAALHQPLLFPAVLARTYILHGPKLFATLFQFGWLNVSAGFVSIVLTVLALHSVLTAGEPSHQRLRRLDRIWILALVAASILLISLAAWVYGTPAQLDWIFGLQGRYFIPLFPAAFVAALPNRKSSPAGTHRVAILMIAANLFTLGSIAQAFYR